MRRYLLNFDAERLEQIKIDFDNGRRNYHPHELIEESARGKALA